MKKKPHSSPEALAFARRLRLAIQQAGYKVSATVLAHHFNLKDRGEGVTPHAARNWLNGVSIPKQIRLKVLSDILHITPHDLLFGPHPANDVALPTGYVDRGKSCDPAAKRGVASDAHEAIALADRLMWHTYRGLNLEHRRMVRELTNGLRRLEKKQSGDDAADPHLDPDTAPKRLR